jgi:hypothetical protein
LRAVLTVTAGVLLKIAKLVGVGTGTVQRIARELGPFGAGGIVDVP